MYKRLAAGLVGLMLSGCATRVNEVVEQTAVLVPDKSLSLDEHVRRAFARPETVAAMRLQYDESKQTGLEWGGVLIETDMGTEYVPIPNAFAEDLALIYQWHAFGDARAKSLIDANLHYGECHQRNNRDLNDWNFKLNDIEFVRNGIHRLPGADLHTVRLFMSEYHERIQKWMYAEEAAGLARALTRGRLMGHVHAHPGWVDLPFQSSKTDRNISRNEDLVLIVPKDAHFRVFTIQKEVEKEVAQVYILGEPAVAPYVEEK